MVYSKSSLNFSWIGLEKFLIVLLMSLEKLNSVKTYSGYKSSERPLSFVLNNIEIIVEEIIETKLIENKGQKRDRRQLFKVRGNDKNSYTLYHSLDSSEWFIDF